MYIRYRLRHVPEGSVALVAYIMLGSKEHNKTTWNQDEVKKYTEYNQIMKFLVKMVQKKRCMEWL